MNQHLLDSLYNTAHKGDLLHQVNSGWQKADKFICDKINKLLKDIARTPFGGIGKPEPLKHEFKGYWSRRINDEHRLVYRVTDDYIPNYR
jgi:toxin YoeB